MSANSASGRQDPTTSEYTEGPGRRLRLARQAKGLDLGRIASELRLSTTVIESLEQDDYEALPGQVFVVGYIRKYARLVGLAPEPLLASFQAGEPPQTEPVLAGTAPRTERRMVGSRIFIWLAGAALLIPLAALAFLWWKTQQPDIGMESAYPRAEQEADASVTGTSASEPPATASPIGTDPTALPAESEPLEAEPAPPPPIVDRRPPAATGQQEDGILATAPAEDTREPADSSRDAVTDIGVEPGVQDVEAPVAARTEVDEPDVATREIVMSFDGTCWVDVRDSERKYMLFGEMKKGDRHVLEGKPPYSVIIGNVAAVQINVGGEPFDLSALSRGNVARFSLDPEKGRGPGAEGRGSASTAVSSIP